MTPSDYSRLSTIDAARRCGFVIGYILTDQASEASLVLCFADGIEPQQFTDTKLELVLEAAERWLLDAAKKQTPEAIQAWRSMVKVESEQRRAARSPMRIQDVLQQLAPGLFDPNA